MKIADLNKVTKKSAFYLAILTIQRYPAINTKVPSSVNISFILEEFNLLPLIEWRNHSREIKNTHVSDKRRFESCR